MKRKKDYSIGEFAAINKISARMLRHYDKIGLLKPVAIGANGYRTYSSEQITIVGLIKKYRDCQFSLQEIEYLLKANEEEVKRFSERKIQELYLQEKASNQAISMLKILAGNVKERFENQYEISFSQQNERGLFCFSQPCLEEQIEDTFEMLYEKVEEHTISSSGLLMLLSHLKERDSYYPAIPIPIKECVDIIDCQTIVLASGWYLSTFHYGDYYSIGNAYDKLLQYAQSENIKLSEPFIERYFVDCTHSSNETEYITEISIKITP